ncbi:MAG: MmgE/PrpD family protein [Anaerolineae bacterium]|nr:MmgE/PrpD family protein [Anaerolineae bacterium]
MLYESVIEFIHSLRFDQLPDDVIRQTQRCLLDLIGTAAGGSTTDTARIINQHAVRYFAAGFGKGSPLLLDGRRASPPGAALAGGQMIDSMDCHDGHVLCKGHVGVAVFPALLALISGAYTANPVDGREFITSLVLGYEIATRAGITLHNTVCDFHSSGAWNTLACAALGARLMRLDPHQTWHALGIAEYHGPRSQIMRVVDHPTMIKDGSGWGAMAGLSAAFLAADGFTGAPALTLTDERTAAIWSDVGQRWRIREQYFKAYPVCRWAQPAVEAALGLQRAHGINAAQIAHVEVNTFHEGVRLSTRCPESTDEAQYSLPFPVAVSLVRGQLGATEVTGDSLRDPAVLRLSTGTVLVEDDGYNTKFPAERWAHVSFVLNDGTRLTSDPAIARGNPENPLSDAELDAKYHTLTEPVLGTARAGQIRGCVADLASDHYQLDPLLELLLIPPDRSH